MGGEATTLPAELFLCLSGPQCPPCQDHDRAVQMAAVIEYLCDEVLELSGYAAMDFLEVDICPNHIALALYGDKELQNLFDRCFTSPRAFVIPNPRYPNPNIQADAKIMNSRVAKALLAIQLRERSDDAEAIAAARDLVQKFESDGGRLFELLPDLDDEKSTPTALGRIVKPLRAFGVNVGENRQQLFCDDRHWQAELGTVIGEARDGSPHYAYLVEVYGMYVCVNGFDDEMEPPDACLVAISFQQLMECLASALEDVSVQWMERLEDDLTLGYEPWSKLARKYFPDFTQLPEGFDFDSSLSMPSAAFVAARAVVNKALSDVSIPLAWWSIQNHPTMPHQLKQVVMTFFLCCQRHANEGSLPSLPKEIRLHICEFLRANDGADLALI